MSAVRPGEEYIALSQGGARVEVRRVARDHAWADIRVTQPHGATWTKRQPLQDGRFTFPVQRVDDARPPAPSPAAAENGATT